MTALAQRTWPGAPVHGPTVRDWVGGRVRHADAGQVAQVLWAVLLHDQPAEVVVAITAASTPGRTRISLYVPGPVRPLGPGADRILAQLAAAHGVTADRCGRWAEVET